MDVSKSYGPPKLIKMDIEGSEIEFLKSESFRQWVNQNKVSIMLQTHGDAKDFVWPEFNQLGENDWILKRNK